MPHPRETVQLARRRIMRFNEEIPGYNPLFLNQGDSPIKQNYADFLVVNEIIDAEDLSGVTYTKKRNSFLRSKAGSMVNPDDVPNMMSPMAPKAREISNRVHKTLPRSPHAYDSQIKGGVELIKNDKVSAKTVFDALKKKGVSPTITRETLKMVERGVPADQIKNQVVQMLSAASNIPAKAIKSPRSVEVLSRDIIPDIVMKQRESEPTVTQEEMNSVAHDIVSDSVIRQQAAVKRVHPSRVVSQITPSHVDEVLKTVAISSIMHGAKEPSDGEITAPVNVPSGFVRGAPAPSGVNVEVNTGGGTERVISRSIAPINMNVKTGNEMIAQKMKNAKVLDPNATKKKVAIGIGIFLASYYAYKNFG